MMMMMMRTVGAVVLAAVAVATPLAWQMPIPVFVSVATSPQYRATDQGRDFVVDCYDRQVRTISHRSWSVVVVVVEELLLSISIVVVLVLVLLPAATAEATVADVWPLFCSSVGRRGRGKRRPAYSKIYTKLSVYKIFVEYYHITTFVYTSNIKHNSTHTHTVKVDFRWFLLF